MLTKTAERPPRLICTQCGRVVPQTNLTPLLGWLDRHWGGLLVLALLILMPLVLLALSPWMENPAAAPERRRRWREHKPSLEFPARPTRLRSPVDRRLG